MYERQNNSILSYCYLCLFLLLGCNADEVCRECTQNNQKSNFENVQFWFRISLVDYLDSIAGDRSTYKLCPSSEVQGLESGKIIRASGSVYNSCQPSTADFALITDFEVIDVCPDPIPNIVGEFALENSWWFDHMVYQGVKVYRPCESDPNSLMYLIKLNNPNLENQYGISTIAARNTLDGIVTISTDTISFTGSFVVTIGVGTRSERAFEEKYFEGISPNKKLIYNISDNHLWLYSFDHDIIYNYYTK